MPIVATIGATRMRLTKRPLISPDATAARKARMSPMSVDRRGSLVRKADLADPQIVLCGPGREGLPESGFVHGNDPACLVAHLFHHGLSGHDQIELASSRQPDGKVEIVDFQLL